MLRPFVGRFLLPLVKGGKLHVGRPLGTRAVEELIAAWSAPEHTRTRTSDVPSAREREAAEELARLRGERARSVLFGAQVPHLDEATFRLGAALHNLLVLAHPDIGDPHAERARRRIATAALTLADLGPPASAAQTVERHTLLARAVEIVQPEHVVTYWLGRRSYVGRAPPARLLALPRLRRVKREDVRRLWIREVGVPAFARPAWIALHRASPLGEALDPLRLDPPLSWERVLPVLRFPGLARVVVGGLLEIGLPSAGNAYATALFRYAALREPGGGAKEEPGAPLAFAIRFLAHAVWMEILFRGGNFAVGEGTDLATLMVAAHEVDPRLVIPDDVSLGSDLAREYLGRLGAWRSTVLSRTTDGYATALRLCRRAAAAAAAAAREPAPLPPSNPGKTKLWGKH
jgi:hypothetical protein